MSTFTMISILSRIIFTPIIFFTTIDSPNLKGGAACRVLASTSSIRVNSVGTLLLGAPAIKLPTVPR